MTHILFDGDIRQHPALRSLLWQWGVTVGRLLMDDRDGARPTVEDCDAVVHLCGEPDFVRFVSSAMPDGADPGGAVAAAAPLLVIGTETAPDMPWFTIPDCGPGGSLLKAALQTCQERSRALRGDPGFRQDLDQFRDFIGHELRTPLTAIKTALSVLPTDESSASGPGRMLRIARRNLLRLEKTVGWSQELMSLAEAPPVAVPGPVRLGDLVKAFPKHLDVQLDGGDRSSEIFTDPGLLGTLAGQMERVLSYACPGCRPVFRLEPDSETGECRLSALAEEKGDQGEQWRRSEFEHLTRMLISPQLLQALGVRIRIPADDRDGVKVSIGLPEWAAAPDPALGSLLSV